jgi:integrase
MIKITNLNFQNQTIENIEVNCNDLHDVELKLTKSTFKITIVKAGVTMQKQIEKKDISNEVIDVVMDEPVIDEPVMEIEKENDEEVEPVMEEVEPVMEEVYEEIAEVVEPVSEEPLTLGKLKELLKEHIPKPNTLDSYVRTIKQIHEHFKIDDMRVLLITKEQDIINYIESNYTNNSTIKSKLCSVYKAYKILEIEGNLFKQRIDFYATKQTLKQEETKEDNKKSVDEGNSIVEHFKNHLEDLGKTIQNDTSENDNAMINNWSVEVQLFCVLKLYLTYGVIRSSELINCKICDCDGDDTTNYINVNKKQIVINNHKNDRKGKKVIDISSDKKLLGILRKGIGQFLVTTQQGELYQSSSAFSKVFFSRFGFNVYDLRKAISSKFISEGNIEEIKKLEHVQGHDLKTILEFYNVYSK